jgi:hypothetical protein
MFGSGQYFSKGSNVAGSGIGIGASLLLLSFIRSASCSEAGLMTDSILTLDYVDLEPGDYAFKSKHLGGGGECDCHIN